MISALKIEKGIVVISGALLLLSLLGYGGFISFSQRGIFDSTYHRQDIMKDHPKNGVSIDTWSKERPYICEYFKRHADGSTGYHCAFGDYIGIEIFGLPNIFFLTLLLFIDVPLFIIFIGTLAAMFSEQHVLKIAPKETRP